MLTIEVEFHFASGSMEDNSKYFPLSSVHGFYGNEEGASGMFSQGTPSHLFYQYTRPMHWPQSSPNATQSSSSSLSNASCSRSQSPNSSTASEDTNTPRRSYDKWTEEQELFLIDLWAEYDDELESSQSRKYWATIQERLNNRFHGAWSKDQIQRKIRYLKEQFKKASDWNRKQSGGNRKTSPHYDRINEIIGKKDSVTMKHVVSAGNSCSSADRPSTSDHEETSKDPNKSETESKETEMTNKSKAAKYSRQERKRRRTANLKPEMNEFEDEDRKRAVKLDETLDGLQEQGNKIAKTMENIVDSIQQNQSEQLQFMGQFMKIFAEIAKKQQ